MKKEIQGVLDDDDQSVDDESMDSNSFRGAQPIVQESFGFCLSGGVHAALERAEVKHDELSYIHAGKTVHEDAFIQSR